jgi:hydroxypyruvate isomerase
MSSLNRFPFAALLVKGLIQISDSEFNDDGRTKTSIIQIINSIKGMKQINILSLLLLPLFSIGWQTLSWKECYALSIKIIARQTDTTTKSVLEIEAINKAKLPKIDLNAQQHQSDASLPIGLPNVTVNPLPTKIRTTVDVNQLI